MQLGSRFSQQGPPPAAGADPVAAPSGPEFTLYPPRTRVGLDPSRREEFIERVAGLRRAYLAQPAASAMSSLQILDIDQMRLRFGRRWPGLRPKVLSIVEAAIQREVGKDDLYVAVSETIFHLFRVGLKRRDAERRGRLLAAEVTERLCGTVPGGVAVRMKTVGFDFNHGLAGIASFEQLRNRVEAFGKALDDRELRLFLDNVGRLEPLFRPTIHFRKGLVSAYHLAPLLRTPNGRLAPVSTLCPDSFNGVFDAETDNWVVQQAAAALAGAAPEGPGHRRGRGPARARQGRPLRRSQRDPPLPLPGRAQAARRRAPRPPARRRDHRAPVRHRARRGGGAAEDGGVRLQPRARRHR